MIAFFHPCFCSINSSEYAPLFAPQASMKDFPSADKVFHTLWDEIENKPQLAVLEIGRLTGLDLSHLQDYQQLIDITQKHWLRPKSTERWEIQESSWSPQKKKELLHWFRILNLIEGIEPTLQQYDALGILGAKVQSIYMRTQHAQQLLQRQEIRANDIHEIAGERPLTPDEVDFIVEKDPFNAIAEQFNDETLAAQWVGEQLLQQSKWKLIAAPKQKGSIRATTSDTIYELAHRYLDLLPKQERAYLLVSSQPHCYYQLLTSQICLKKLGYNYVKFDVTGPAILCPEKTKIGVYLDTLARIIFAIGEDRWMGESDSKQKLRF